MRPEDDSGETDRFPAVADVEAVFSEFVRNANAIAKQDRTRRAAVMPDEGEAPPTTDDSLTMLSPRPARPLLLTRRKEESQAAIDVPTDEEDDEQPLPSPGPGETTQRREAKVLVPEVRKVKKPRAPLPERSEDGQIPSGELDRVLADMATLLRYGHAPQVRGLLEQLSKRYPQDLLLVRRITEFQLQSDDKDGAIETLFVLARRLFERRNLAGMRESLAQILALDPQNPRAHKLLALLEAR